MDVPASVKKPKTIKVILSRRAVGWSSFQIIFPPANGFSPLANSALYKYENTKPNSRGLIIGKNLSVTNKSISSAALDQRILATAFRIHIAGWILASLVLENTAEMRYAIVLDGLRIRF
jgi:hypothetical protein